ncbi:integral membrane sensor signal transduction histidine kinase [Arcobacter nitrofigilis DSM 7299]|uniref:Integral membrane sensor signal transduction histidine kinase n=1 Tax=Arcobacter nitrofigilis (strain ATCC 33309 / DSM 7299 / CCUG 15893 / LMG 7604 / NCTC 12251 / CI) TaxID=572480 RepID=D5V311_ARCNC|nr:ATP-binding protein [Arcobacter nitrofigilis]ADG92593.1 integral membrane sensor signal transduction histidine kinase [Arcobacter nitrofigilis DSM 7299]
MKKKALIIYILLFFAIIFTFIFISFNYLKNHEKKLLDNKYKTLSTQINKNINFLIEDKKTATLTLAIATSKFENIKNTFITRDIHNFNLSEFSKELSSNTSFKNIWFMLIDKDGTALYRSWNEHKNDTLLFRKGIKNILKNPKITNTIAVGRYDMTFHSIIPIYDNKKFLGIFEVITHFNSIAKDLTKSNTNSVILADKKYFNTLKYPFSNNFINQYYITNLDAKDNLINLIKKIGIEKILKTNGYLIVDNKFISTYKIEDSEKDNIGYIISSKGLKDIDMSDISKFKTNFITNAISLFILLTFVLSLIFYYIFSRKVLIEKKKAQQILDSQQNIIILTDGEVLNNANKQFLNFFNQYHSVEEFKKEHKCICEMFVDINDENYITDKDYNGKNWAQFILENPKINLKAAMIKDEQIRHFLLNVSLNLFSGEEIPYIVVTLTDITLDIKQKSELKLLNDNLELLVEEKTKELKNLNESLEIRIEKEILKNKKKDEILFEHNKMLAMGEMINNIAHQWRQPLSAISSSASSILLKKEMNSLDDESLDFLCSHIVESSIFLSKTIEDFRIFYNEDEKEEEFLLEDIINQNIKIITNKLEDEHIKIVSNIVEKIKIFATKKQFQRAVLNIINNAIEALIENKKDQRYIFITTFENSLSIKDNANGINKDIMEHIFEPYFTTKHKSQGRGIGLYMAKIILEKNMPFKLDVENKAFTYKEKEYFGANFIINFNK